ncbi:hypothetical protein SERLADRAFT_464678, partial [Serpula lacrymans var. lacrymans S7.9]
MFLRRQTSFSQLACLIRFLLQRSTHRRLQSVANAAIHSMVQAWYPGQDVNPTATMSNEAVVPCIMLTGSLPVYDLILPIRTPNKIFLF